MIPGQHEICANTTQRDLGSLRDTILILQPGPKVLVVSLHRAPLDGSSVVENLLKHGHGALNIDGCRIHVDEAGFGNAGAICYGKSNGAPPYDASKGRWPPNVLLVHTPECRQVDGDVWACQFDCPSRLLADQSGYTSSGGPGKKTYNYDDGHGWGTMRGPGTCYAFDEGGTASRFFPQFASLADALAWIDRLIGRK